MPELTTLSIKVSVAPQVERGLHALVREHPASAPARPESPDRPSDRGTIVNQSFGDVHGTLFQIGTVHGNVNRYGDR
ncbi:hypothetical protein V1227_21770 [Lentzea sp. DG1S-22]|uniref:hypothetical protein n=1 Tax=Lentzea sp. DG1S-22 TaxID=3108822 RepID=UPI002E7910B3|nr:hypothetical protein [Lentzea sp. DG1S-22]WVH77739.1 hypothetical protein V1227_21770 [Lentzea sp. DG1S-22]